MAKTPEPWRKGAILPNGEYASAYRVLATIAYPRIKEIIEQTVSSGLIYLNSHAVDFKNPELRPFIDKYIRGSNGYDAENRVKVLKLLWDAIGSEFGGRHELYERNYAGNFENIRIETLLQATGLGRVDELKAFVETCMSEYDLDGWKVSDLINPRDVSWILNKDRLRN
jgi:4-hydroxyphenylacetate 3-monooxygenase